MTTPKLKYRTTFSHVVGRAEWEAAKAGPVEHGPSNYLILDGMCLDGHIAPGRYNVRVSW